MRGCPRTGEVNGHVLESGKGHGMVSFAGGRCCLEAISINPPKESGPCPRQSLGSLASTFPPPPPLLYVLAHLLFDSFLRPVVLPLCHPSILQQLLLLRRAQCFLPVGVAVEELGFPAPGTDCQEVLQSPDCQELIRQLGNETSSGMALGSEDGVSDARGARRVSLSREERCCGVSVLFRILSGSEGAVSLVRVS